MITSETSAARRPDQCAIVVGAGIAGLAASTVLADHFDSVVVLERDILSNDGFARAGTPQSAHLHVLMGGGLRVLRSLFPDFESDLIEAGAVRIRAGLDSREEVAGFGPLPSRDLGIDMYGISRPLAEKVIRRRVRALPNVEFRDQTRVLKVLTTPDGLVAGVRIRDAAGQTRDLEAAIVVDASGRAALTADLLQSLGLSLPDESKIGIDVGYATAIFAIPTDAPAGWRAVFTPPSAAEGTRGAMLYPRERQQWTVTIIGVNGDHPPGDEEGFRAFARSLRTSTISRAIENTVLVGDVHRFHLPSSVWRHYERLVSFPDGLIPIGDAICQFNPVYGQGMSVALQEAEALARILGHQQEQSMKGVSRSFLAAVQPLIATPWATAAVPDFAFPGTTGERPADLIQKLQFGRALIRAAAADPILHRLVAEVRQLLTPPSVFSEPHRLRQIMAELGPPG